MSESGTGHVSDSLGVSKILGQVYNNTLIPEFMLAVPAVLHRVVKGAYNPATGSVVNTDLAINVTTLITQYSQNDVQFSNGAISLGDLQFKLQATPTLQEVMLEDYLVYRGVNYQIMDVEHVMLNGAILQFVCQGRKV